jgi:hypothetical protein
MIQSGYGFLQFQTNTGFINDFTRIFTNPISIRRLISDFEKTLEVQSLSLDKACLLLYISFSIY